MLVLTSLLPDTARTIITRNRSPDIPFEQSINPYRGCEHGCVYCYARPSHAYLDLSPGQDFETHVFFKPKAREHLIEELARPGYRVKTIALGTNTDAYQLVERDLEITRSLLTLLLECRHPVSIVTKGSLIERDLDLLAELARLRLVHVLVSFTTLDDDLKRRMEPRTASPRRRLAMIRALADCGVPTGVLLAPIIPALNDHELEDMLARAADAGASWAGYVLLKLPHELKSLFTEWLNEHYPERAEHVLSLIRQMRGGRLNDPRFGYRQRGTGPFAELLEARFLKARKLNGLDRDPEPLDHTRFTPPSVNRDQLSLW